MKLFNVYSTTKILTWRRMPWHNRLQNSIPARISNNGAPKWSQTILGVQELGSSAFRPPLTIVFINLLHDDLYPQLNTLRKNLTRASLIYTSGFKSLMFRKRVLWQF